MSLQGSAPEHLSDHVPLVVAGQGDHILLERGRPLAPCGSRSKGCVQNGHLPLLLAHSSMQAKQNWYIQKATWATSSVCPWHSAASSGSACGSRFVLPFLTADLLSPRSSSVPDTMPCQERHAKCWSFLALGGEK